MWHKLCRTFHPWCPCIKTRCLLYVCMRECCSGGKWALWIASVTIILVYWWVHCRPTAACWSCAYNPILLHPGLITRLLVVLGNPHCSVWQGWLAEPDANSSGKPIQVAFLPVALNFPWAPWSQQVWCTVLKKGTRTETSLVCNCRHSSK